MNILFYFGGFASTGGIETFCKNLLSYLQNSNFKCTLVCWGELSPLISLIKKSKVNIIRNSWRWGCRWNLPDWLLLPFGLNNLEQADVIILGKLLPLKILKIIKKKARVNTKFVYITPYKPLPPKNLEEKKYNQESLNTFDLIVVQASSFLEELNNLNYRGKSVVIPYITSQPDKIQYFPDLKEIKIGFLGRLVEDKNISLLLNSFKILQENYIERKTSLHLFGDGYLRQKLEQLASDLNINNSVIFHGNIPQSEVASAISSCHIFSFTSHVEGQCLAALEILACGRPIVATEAGAFPDILADSRLGKLVIDASPEKFADSLIEISKLIQHNQIDPEEIKTAYLERYSPNLIGDSYCNLLASCV